MVAPTSFLAPKNGARSALAASMDGVTNPVTFSVTGGQGALFPQPSTDGPFMVTIDNEILKVTARTVDSLTASRAQEGTSIATHAGSSTVELRITAKTVSDIHTILRGLERSVFGQIGQYTPASVIGGGTGGLVTEGLFDASTVTGAGTSVRTLSANGVSADIASGNVAGNNAGVESVLVTRTSLSPVLAGRIYLPTATGIRGFFGIADQTLDAMVSADNPAGNYAGLVYNDAVSANWRFLRKDSATQTFNDTSQAIGTVPVFFLLEAATASLTLSLYDASFAKLYDITVTTLLPTSTADLRVVCGLETTGAFERKIGIYNVILANYIGRVSVL